MGFSVHWTGLAALSCLLCMGVEVWCDCTEAGMEIEGGEYILTGQLRTGSTLIYRCPNGYYPYPVLTHQCQHDGSWTPKPKRQRCRPVECPDPRVLKYGDVNPRQDRYHLDDETTYECYAGIKMQGSSRRVCLPTGKWSGSTPICRHDSEDLCPDPGIPPGASRTGNSFEIGDIVEYTCYRNLILVGPSYRECQENGHWTGKEPACYYEHTYDSVLEVSRAFGSAIMGSLTTLQSTDDTNTGRMIRLSKNGTLNIYVAMDISQSIEKDQIEKSKEAIITLITKIASFTVTPNYEIVFFSGETFEVVSILDFFNGKVNMSNVKERIKKFDVGSNNAGTDLNKVFKNFLEKMGIIKTRVGVEGFKEHRHVIIVFTDGGYNIGGSPAPTVKRIKNMVYMNSTRNTESQPRDDYLDIYIFAIGAEIFTKDLQQLTVGTGGTHFFKMKDIGDLDETFDAIIDEDKVKDLCGVHKPYKSSDDPVERNMYPWLAHLFIPTENRICMGSLVSRQFVLTSAHCVPSGLQPKDVRIEIDDGQIREKKIKTITRHPKYNPFLKAEHGVREFYDYDVALIQLVEEVDISNNVRPICIPCTQDTSDALQLVEASNCIEQEQLLFKGHLEKLSFLTGAQSEISEKHVQAKLGDIRDDCIKHALSAPGITTNNPKDAVTDNFLCTGGQKPSSDHIACPGDSGGAVFKDYEQRTVQVAVVSWGTENLCETDRLPRSTVTSRDFHLNLFRVVDFLKRILGNKDQTDYIPLTFL